MNNENNANHVENNANHVENDANHVSRVEIPSINAQDKLTIVIIGAINYKMCLDVCSVFPNSTIMVLSNDALKSCNFKYNIDNFFVYQDFNFRLDVDILMLYTKKFPRNIVWNTIRFVCCCFIEKELEFGGLKKISENVYYNIFCDYNTTTIGGGCRSSSLLLFEYVIYLFEKYTNNKNVGVVSDIIKNEEYLEILKRHSVVEKIKSNGEKLDLFLLSDSNKNNFIINNVKHLFTSDTLIYSRTRLNHKYFKLIFKKSYDLKVEECNERSEVDLSNESTFKTPYRLTGVEIINQQLKDVAYIYKIDTRPNILLSQMEVLNNSSPRKQSFRKKDTLKKVLWISNVGISSSYHYVTHNIIPHLIKRRNKNGIEVFLFCIGRTHNTQSLKEVSVQFGIDEDHLYSLSNNDHHQDLTTTQVGNHNEEDYVFTSNYLYGIFHIHEIIEEVNPDIIISINDTEPIKRQFMYLKSLPNGKEYIKKFVPYITLDCGNPQPNWVDKLYHHIITMTDFSKVEYENLFERIRIEASTTSDENESHVDVIPQTRVDVIPHVCNDKLFYPLSPEEKVNARKKYDIPLDAFVVGAINSNIYRKRWDLLIEAFCIAAQSAIGASSNLYLLIKTDNVNVPIKSDVIPNKSYDLKKLIEDHFNIRRINLSRVKLLFTSDNKSLSYSELNELYNCCNVGLNTTSGEGFGLSPCEMSLCKIPQILPNYTSFSTLFSGIGGLIDARKTAINFGRDLCVRDDHIHNYISIFKCYTHFKHEVIEEKILNSSSTSVKILITRYLEDNLEGTIAKFKKLSDAINHFKILRSRNALPHKLEFLISLDYKLFESEEFQTSIDIDNFKKCILNDECDNRKYVFCVEPFHRLDKCAIVGVVNVNDVANKLIEFANNREMCKKEGEMCFNIIKEKTNVESVIKKFENYILNF